MSFADVAEVHRAFETGSVHLHARVRARIREILFDDDGERVHKFTLTDTTVGRALLSEIMPAGLPFELVNHRISRIRALTRAWRCTLPVSNAR